MKEVQEEEKKKGNEFKVKTLEEQPHLGPHLLWIWQAFTDLNYRRQVAGFGTPVPISYTEIDAYCRFKGINSPNERERLLRLLDPLDRAWMAKANEEAEKQQTSPKDKTAPPSHSPPRGGGHRPPPRKQMRR